MKFVKIDTSDGESRWINLAQVSRVTRGTDDYGAPLLVLLLANGDPDLALRIHGTDEKNRRAIRAVTTQLDRLAGSKSASPRAASRSAKPVGSRG